MGVHCGTAMMLGDWKHFGGSSQLFALLAGAEIPLFQMSSRAVASGQTTRRCSQCPLSSLGHSEAAASSPTSLSFIPAHLPRFIVYYISIERNE